MADDNQEGAMVELIPMDSPARSMPLSHSMNVERERHLERILDASEGLISDKFRRGQAEHGGNIWEKPGMLQHALDESADQVVYLYTLEGQMSALAHALRTGAITAKDAADALERMLRT